MAFSGRRSARPALHVEQELHTSEAEAEQTDGGQHDSSSPGPLSPPSKLEISIVSHGEGAELSSIGLYPAPFARMDLSGIGNVDRSDRSYRDPADRPLTDDDKVVQVLDRMQSLGPRFSLSAFLFALFNSSDPRITAFSHRFESDNGVARLLGIWDQRLTAKASAHLDNWAVQRAASVCNRHASFLTDRAASGPFTQDAESLHLTASKASVERLRNFTQKNLCLLYNRTLAPLQVILEAVIAKPGEVVSGSRDPALIRTFATSVLLNARSRKTNIHQSVLAVSSWSLGVQRRHVEMMNHLGVSVSYQQQIALIKALANDSVRLARATANNRLLFPSIQYDNFNWMAKAYEAVKGHSSVQHDQVSGILIAMVLPHGASARALSDPQRFDDKKGSRLAVSPAQSLLDIIPSFTDQDAFQHNAVLHVATIICSHIPQLQPLLAKIPSFIDPKAIKPHITDQHFLPTLDQEQGTVQGNIEVLNQYIFNVLKIPKEALENRMVGILGDRLTTARDRAAQVQRALDRSDLRADQLPSIVLLIGLMHTRLAFLELFNRNIWQDLLDVNGDPTCLAVLKSLLPHRTQVIHGKIDFYAWLAFVEVDLAALVFAAGSRLWGCTSVQEFIGRSRLELKSWEQLKNLAKSIVDQHLMPSPDRLEEEGLIQDNHSVAAHASLALRDMMILHELTHSIKHGHPSRILRCLKYLYPMFYAGGSYNYASEIGELLHNIIHDWPPDSADVLLSSLLVNTTGRSDGFKETDLNGEHFNKAIKKLAHGPNMTPHILSQLTPALGHADQLTNALFTELGAEQAYTHHNHVLATEDVHIVAEHLIKHHVFSHSPDDTISRRPATDLFSKGLDTLAAGGHARHLHRYALGNQDRHLNLTTEEQVQVMGELNLELSSLQLENYEIGDEDDHTLEVAEKEQ